MSVAPPARISGSRDSSLEAKIAVQLRSGYHVNSNAPSEDYLIPLRLTWEPGALEAGEIVYPKPKMEKYSFSPRPLSVFTGDFAILSRFRAKAVAPPGPGVMTGKLRYQACTNTTCLPPRTVEVRLPYELR